jgi:hypothetical protein
MDCKLRQHLLLPANHTYRCRYFWSNDWVMRRGFKFQADPSRLRFVRWQKRSLSSLDGDDEREIADFFSKPIHRSWDSSTGGREVFPLLTKTTRQTDREPETEIWDTPEERRPGTARISIPGGFIEAEIRPLVEEKSLFSWRTRPDGQTDRQTENQRQRFETLLKRDGPVQCGFLFQADSSKPRFVHWWKRSLCSLDEDDQTDRQTENQRHKFETILKRDGRVQRIPKEPAVAAAAARGGGEQEGFWLRWWRWKRWRSC